MSYILGIDGGGTKTVAIISDQSGKVLGRGASRASNYQTVGLDNAIAAIEEAYKNSIADAGIEMNRFKVACFGLAGVGRETDRALLMPALEELEIADKIILEHDAVIALAGATACQPGIVVLAGTGAMVFGTNRAGKKMRSGGWGNIMGDEGSAYYIGRRALAAACRAYDGRGPKTALVNGLIEHLKLVHFTDIVRKIYGKRTSPEKIASIAPLVSQLAEAGDEVAINILKDSAEELALAAKAVIKGLNMEDEKLQIAISGSVFSAGDTLLIPFSESIKSTTPKAEIIKPRFEPAMGAILLALQDVGIKPGSISKTRMNNNHGGTMEGVMMRKREIRSDKVAKVVAIKNPDKFRALDAVLESTGFFELLDEACKNSQKDKEDFAIIIKPNFMFLYSRKDISTFTDPALVEYLVDRIYSLGYRNLTVAEAKSTYGIFFTNREVKTIAEYIGLSGKNYRIIDLSEDLVPYQYAGKLGEHYVNREWKDADFRISFAKNKTHCYAYYTLTMKNIYGALPCENKLLEYHNKRDIHSTTIEYIKHFPIHFGLIDASFSADGPLGIFADREPNRTDTIIGGKDIVAVDWVGASKMGLDPMQSVYMKEAVKIFSKPEIELIGEKEVYPNWVNVSDRVTQTFFGMDRDYYFVNIAFSTLSYMDPFFQYKDKSLSKKFLRALADPLKSLFFQRVGDDTLDIDLNRKLYRIFNKAMRG